MRKNTGVILITFGLLFILIIGSVTSVTNFEDNNVRLSLPDPELDEIGKTVAYTTHDPIDIDGDIDFNDTAFTEGWAGNGSTENPYIIEGLEIDQGGSLSHCISIINTRVIFIIRNCNLTGAYASPGSGIYLDNVMYGRIESNIVYSCNFNIYLTNSHYVVVKNNTCWDGAYSISLRDSSSNNIITDNNNSENRNRAINLEYASHDNTIINNTCNNNGAFGIVLYRVTYNMVANNSFNGNVDQGVHSNNADHNTLLNNTCNSNGQGIYLFAGSESNEISNNTCNNNRDYGIYFVNAFANDVFNNTCNENEDYGIYFDQGDYADLVNNTCNFNRRGINLRYTDNSIISNNTCNFNDFGILLDYSTVNTISNNTCANSQYGIGLFGDASSNVVEWNTFVDNNNGGYDIGTTNTVDYNYWSDYDGIDADQNGIGDTPYLLLGSTGNQDIHPMMILLSQKIGWVNPPSDQVFEVGESVHYDVNASAFSGIDYWTINDTINFNIDSFGVITNSTILSIEEYGLEISVYDIDSNFLSRTFTVSVVSVFPTWVEVPTDQIILVGENFSYDLNATDAKGLDLWWLNDTVNFDIDQSGIVTNATILPLSSFNLEISVNDTDGHILVGVFSVSIVPYFLDNPIYIDGNQNFTDTALAEEWSGEGTAQSPYSIEILRIERDDEVGHCISIMNTDVHFEIRNCYLTGASINPGAGIYLENVVNGLLAENTISDNYVGITIRDSDSIVAANNTCFQNWNGLVIYASSNNLISNNNCSYNVNRGISIEQNSEYNSYERNICNYNNDGIVINDINVRYETIANNTCSYNTENGIYELSSDLDIIEDNICNNNYRGVYIRSVGNGGDVINNTCNYNTYGIYLEVSDSLTVTNNTCYSNDYGVYNDRGFSNDILWNSFSNNILANGISDAFGANLFDYNYWSDYTGSDNNGDSIGDTPYSIPGTPGDQDLHPLMFPPNVLFNWLQLPTDHIIQCGESFRYDLNASSSEGLDYWWVNDTTTFNIDQDGIITNITNLALGTYGLEVFVNDTSGYVLSGSFNVIVSDSTPPTWDELPITQIIEFGSDFNYNLNATDLSGLDAWWLNDTIRFDIDVSGTVTSNSVLPVGTFGIHVWVNDTFGNILETTFNVVVVDTTGPSWITGPLNQDLEEGAPYIYSLDANDLSGIDMWWVNDTAHFAIDEFGVISNITSLSDGIYPCRVWVNDTSGNILTGVFTLTVHAASPPIWISVPIDQVVEYGEGLIYDLDVTDFSDIDSWWLNDTTYFTIDQDGTITNSTPLVVGTYSLLISVSDTLGYIQSSEITITVEDTTDPSWVQTPVDQIVEYGEYLSYDLNFTDLSEIDEWLVDDTERFSIDWTGQVRSLEILPVGTYGLQIYISDIYDNTLIASILIEVVDTTPPEWLVSVTDQYLEYGDPFEYQLSAYDLSGIDHWSLDDTTNFDIDNLGLITSIGLLEPATYNLRVTVADPHGNELTVVFTIHVSSETTTTTTTTTTTSTTVDEMDPLLVLGLGLGIGGAAVVVIVIVFLRRKS